MDHCFSSLLLGRDIDTNETLPGFEDGLRAGMTITEMVRCRSLVELTRVLIVELMSNPGEEEVVGEDKVGHEEEDALGDDWDTNEGRVLLDAARVYERTIVQLNDRLGDPLEVGPSAASNALCAVSQGSACQPDGLMDDANIP